jgi:hypothetical protein
VLNRDYSGAWAPCCREIEKKELGQETDSKGLRLIVQMMTAGLSKKEDLAVSRLALADNTTQAVFMCNIVSAVRRTLCFDLL